MEGSMENRRTPISLHARNSKILDETLNSGKKEFSLRKSPKGYTGRTKLRPLSQPRPNKKLEQPKRKAKKQKSIQFTTQNPSIHFYE
jgi:hypothetical protein